MPRRSGHVEVRVHFYAVDALDERLGLQGGPEDWVDTIEDMERAEGAANMTTSLFTHMVCDVHGSKPNPRMVGAWQVDPTHPLFVERKGVVTLQELMEDENLAFPTWLMFFPGPVAAVIRSSSTSPGHVNIASYLNQFAKANCTLLPIMEEDAFRRLRRAPEEILSATFKIKVASLPVVKNARPDFAEALETAARPNKSRMVQVKSWSGIKKERSGWWQRTEPIITDLINTGAIDLFETAAVSCSNNDEVNLQSQRLTRRELVQINAGTKRLLPESAAAALVDAFTQARPDLVAMGIVPPEP